MKAKLKDRLNKLTVKELKIIVRSEKELLRKYSNFSKLRRSELLAKLIREHNQKNINLEKIINDELGYAENAKEFNAIQKIKKSIKIPKKIFKSKFKEDTDKLKELLKTVKGGPFRSGIELEFWKKIQKIIKKHS